MSKPADIKQQPIVWPPFLTTPDPSVSVIMEELDKNQWLTADEIRGGQQQQLSALMIWAAKNVPAYKCLKNMIAKLKRLETRPALFWEEWQKLPILTKAQLRSAHSDLEAVNLPATQFPLETIRTSGSTGIPVETLSTALTRMLWSSLTLREHIWQQRDFSQRSGIIRYRPKNERPEEGVLLPSWGLPVDSLYASGPCSVIHIGHPVDVLLRWLDKFDPYYLLAYPSVMDAIEQAWTERGHRSPSLHEIRFISEPLDPALVQRLKEKWQVRSSDLYSSNEVGHIAFLCHEHGNMHVQSESLLVEILDSRGKPCKPGQTGRVVVTSLHNLAMPLIRYELGDYATVGEPCPCGRGLPVIKQVRGRVRNLVSTPDGQRFWPTALGKTCKVSAIKQAQYVQVSPDTIELRVVLERPLTDEEQQNIIGLVQKALRYPFQVEIVTLDEIPRGPSGKFEEFLSLLDA